MFFLLSLVYHALGCSFDFGNGIKIKYHEINFEVHIDIIVVYEIYSKYNWIGLGLKYKKDSSDMKNGDYYTIVFKKHVLTDNFAFENGVLFQDEVLGGSSDLIKGPVSNDDQETRTYTLRRPTNSGDKYDIELRIGESYFWQWAYGKTLNGELQQHDFRGSQDFVYEICEIPKNK